MRTTACTLALLAHSHHRDSPNQKTAIGLSSYSAVLTKPSGTILQMPRQLTAPPIARARSTTSLHSATANSSKQTRNHLRHNTSGTRQHGITCKSEATVHNPAYPYLPTDTTFLGTTPAAPCLDDGWHNHWSPSSPCASKSPVTLHPKAVLDSSRVDTSREHRLVPSITMSAE